jgi:hypothetical protein
VAGGATTNRYARAESFRTNITAAVLVEPALTEGNLPDPADCANFPVVVIESRHDHLNSLLFPLANIPFNTYVASEYANWMVRPRPPAEQFGVEFLHLPYVIAASAVSWPWFYLDGQRLELADTNNWNWTNNYLADSLKQLPVLDAAIREGLGNTNYHKGAFNLGRRNESAARIVAETGADIPVWLDAVAHKGPDGKTDLLTLHRGINFVNAEETVSRSMFWSKIDYNNKLEDYTIGWLDPVGSHDDTAPNIPPTQTNAPPQIYDLVHCFLNGEFQAN